MDCSVGYIEMCRKATEIQEEGKRFKFFDVGNFGVVSGEYHHEKAMSIDSLIYWGDDYEYEYLWLPRQDQLQDMLDIKKLYHIKIRPMTTPMALDYLTYEMWYTVKGETMEQLWLAFVMREKYGKKWNGSDWE